MEQPHAFMLPWQTAHGCGTACNPAALAAASSRPSPASPQPAPCPAVRHAPSSQAAALLAAAVGDDSESASVAASAADSQEEPRFLSFEVMDTGVGVSRKALESLFQDYVQVGAGCPGGVGACVQSWSSCHARGAWPYCPWVLLCRLLQLLCSSLMRHLCTCT